MSAEVGMVHGRFQPYHKGHLDYTLKALEQSRHLYVGITNPDPADIVKEDKDPTRHLPEANAFTYFERLRMVRESLLEEGVGEGRFTIIPFPIHHPERWHHYFPRETVHFIRLFSEWGREKVERFERMGHRVVVLDPGVHKEVSGSEVRARLLNGGDWESLLPPAVARVLKEVGARERILAATRK